MQHDIIARLAFTLSARLWMNLLCAYGLPLAQAHAQADYILHHQEEVTALDWIIATHRKAQLQIPTRCLSLQGR